MVCYKMYLQPIDQSSLFLDPNKPVSAYSTIVSIYSFAIVYAQALVYSIICSSDTPQDISEQYKIHLDKIDGIY